MSDQSNHPDVLWHFPWLSHYPIDTHQDAIYRLVAGKTMDATAVVVLRNIFTYKLDFLNANERIRWTKSESLQLFERIVAEKLPVDSARNALFALLAVRGQGYFRISFWTSAVPRSLQQQDGEVLRR
ncbi:MAG: hypothetical protein LBC42_02125 [Puniceicoccales bacterium]|jgi:hypothetical protein|nr:hypothetical protein [Puniceicoccales bacterium]